MINQDTPEPCSAEALARGCICDPAGWADRWVNVKCPLHGKEPLHVGKAVADRILPPKPDNLCRACRRPVRGFRDQLSVKEFGISQMCQHCQDGVFADIEAIFPELGLDFEAEQWPTEEQLIDAAQRPNLSADAQRWVASDLYRLAYVPPA